MFFLVVLGREILNNMKKLLAIFSFIVILILLTNCKRECKKDDLNKGIIISTEKLNAITRPESGLVVLDSATFFQNFPFDSLTIDFNLYSLLGLYVKGGGCNWSVTREVTRLENEKQYHYKVMAYDCGICQKLFYDYNWVKVPKLPSGWTVTFEKHIH